MSHKSLHFTVPFKPGESVAQHEERVERVWTGAFAHGRAFWGQVELLVTDLLTGIFDSDEYQLQVTMAKRELDRVEAQKAVKEMNKLDRRNRVARRLAIKEAEQQTRAKRHHETKGIFKSSHGGKKDK